MGWSSTGTLVPKVFVAGWRHTLWCEWPIIIIITGAQGLFWPVSLLTKSEVIGICFDIVSNRTP